MGRTKIALLAAAVMSSFALPVSAAEGPWLVRLRAPYLEPSDKSDAIPALAVPADAITANDKRSTSAAMTLGGAKVTEVNVDPILWSAGLGWRF